MTEQLQILAGADARARRAAATEFDAPLVLEAGAGTGKTAVLVARALFWALGPGFDRALARAEGGAAGCGSSDSGGDSDGDEAAAGRVLERITAITFTDRAAAEMAERVAEALGALVAGERVIGLPLDALDLPRPRVVKRARALLACIDRIGVGTIHAFCRRLLARYPVEAGVHPLFEVDADGTALRRVVEQVIVDKLADAYGDPGDPDFLELAALGHGPLALADALEVLADQAAPLEAIDEDPYRESAVREAAARLDEQLAALDAAMRQAVGSQPLDELTRVRQVLAGIDELRERAVAARAVAQLVEVATSDEVDRVKRRTQSFIRGDFGREQPRDPGRFAALRGPLGAVQRSVTNLSRVDPTRLPLAARTLRPLLARVYERMRAEGVLTFSGLLRGARDLLVGAPEVLRQVRASTDQLLVDEFQDTDPLQCEVIDLIALARADDDGARPALMVVGDPKQSIYGWRNADLAAYEAFVGRVVAAGGQRHPLVVNFRSVGPILDEVQRVIEPVMRQRTGLQPAFQTLLPGRQGASASGAKVASGGQGFRAGDRRAVEHWVAWATPRDDASAGGVARSLSTALGSRTKAEQARRIEARALARELRALHHKHDVPWRAAAILLRTTTAQDTYLSALREAQIPFLVERDRNYYRRREIIDAAALVRTIVDPNDQVALVAWLRSPIVGVPDAALLPLWRLGLPELLARLVPSPGPGQGGALVDATLLDRAFAVVEAAARATPAAPGVERVDGWSLALGAGIRALARLRVSFASEPVDRFIERLRALTLVEETAATRYLGAHRLANLERFFRRLAAGLAGTDVDAAALARPAVAARLGGVNAVLRELRSGVAEARAEEEAAVGDETLDAVRVMTIHKAKGLTFEHVYVVGTHGEPGRGHSAPTNEIDIVDHDEHGVARWSMRLLDVPDLRYGALAARRARVAAAEAVRTLYVAATRPRERLVISGRWRATSSDPRDVEHAMSHADLVEHRRGKRPSLDALFAAKSLARVGADGVRWVLADRIKAARGAEPSRGAAAEVVSLSDARAEVARLAADRAAANRRMARPLTRAASSRSHEQLREQVAAAEPRGLRPRPDESARVDPDLAPVVGTAVHRVLETFDLEAAPEAELARQRALLPAYLLEVDDTRRAEALAACEGWLDRLAGSRCLAELRRVGPRLVAREAPLLLAPSAAHDDVTGALVGTVDLLYRDESGEIVVADYKTDRVEDEAARAARAAVYGEQGRVYVEAVARALDIPWPRFELWFLYADVIERVEITR